MAPFYNGSIESLRGSVVLKSGPCKCSECSYLRHPITGPGVTSDKIAATLDDGFGPVDIEHARPESFTVDWQGEGGVATLTEEAGK